MEADEENDMERVGGGVSHPLSGELGKMELSGRGTADWGVAGESMERLDENTKLCNWC